jgi:serine/threonine-protein kinase
MADASRPLFRLPDAEQLQIEQLVARFEQAWIEGRQPAIETFLPQTVPVREAALIELVHVDCEFRAKAGQAPDVDEYLTRFPELAADPRALADLADQRGRNDALRVTLEILTGPHQGEQFEIDRHQTLLAGRASVAQMRLNKDPHFSRHHFRLEVSPPRCQLIDLDSMNGTFVNGQRVRQTAIQPGDVISGGETQIRLSVSGTETASSFNEPTLIKFAEVDPQADESPVVMIQDTQDVHAEVTDRRIPGYLVQKELGRGGMGIVYRALQRSSGRILALKVMKPGAATSAERLRFFVREASILSQLNHPHIIRFFEMGTAGDEFFVATEYVETVPLAQLLDQRPMEYRVKVVCGVACHVLDALKYAHEQGLVHRDIKPTNILLSRSSGKLQAKLADFGLAKNYEDAGFSEMTQDGEIRGSPAYLSPEQIANARYAKPPCDLYSLGVSMYQMFSGRLPYEVPRGGSILRAILEDPPVPLAERCPELPAELTALVHRALSKVPEERFASAAEMYDALYPFRRQSLS